MTARLLALAQGCSIACCVAMVAVLLPALYSGELFPWHPALMTVGFLGLMTEGMVMAFKFRPLEGGPRVQAIQRHGWIQGGAMLCIVLGFYAIYANKVGVGGVVKRGWRVQGTLICVIVSALRNQETAAARDRSCHARHGGMAA